MSVRNGPIAPTWMLRTAAAHRLGDIPWHPDASCKWGRSTWLALGAGVLVFVGASVWAAIALIGWLWGQTQNLTSVTSETVRGTARVVVAEVDKRVPSARGALDQLVSSVPGARGVLDKAAEMATGASELLDGAVPASQSAPSTPSRDVSGQDLGPVVRWPGLVRTMWQKNGQQVAVEYEGKGNYIQALDHYIAGFTTNSFEQTVLSSTRTAEKHNYTRRHEQFSVTITQQPNGRVSVRIETVLP